MPPLINVYQNQDNLKNFAYLFCVFIVFFSCDKDETLLFKEKRIESTKFAKINILYPKAEGSEKIADRINKSIETFMINALSMSDEDVDQNGGIEEAAQKFDNEYKSFIDEFDDSSQQWEVSIEGEVLYESENLICIVVNTYLDTGGAHGNNTVSFLNFEKLTGKQLEQNDLIKDEKAFKTLAQKYFEKTTEPLTDDEDVEDYFFGEGFILPENIGFNDKGVILLYNVYEVASYVQDVTEFTIPYSEANPYLKIH